MQTRNLGERTRVATMRRLMVMLSAVCLMAASLEAGQLQAREGAAVEPSFVEAGMKAARGLELQPNAVGQRQRRGSRIGTGIGLIVGGGLLIGLQGLWVGELGEQKENVQLAVNLGGLAMIVGGGVAIALADVQAPVVRPRIEESGVGVFATRGGGGVAKRIAW